MELNWHNIKKDGLPKEKGYYNVAIKQNYLGKTTYKSSYIYFRGKNCWATCGNKIVAWLDSPDDYKGECN